MSTPTRTWRLQRRWHFNTETNTSEPCGVMIGCRFGPPAHHHPTREDLEAARRRIQDLTDAQQSIRVADEGEDLFGATDRTAALGAAVTALPAELPGIRVPEIVELDRDGQDFPISDEHPLAALPPGTWVLCDPYLILGRDQQLWNEWIAAAESSTGLEHDVEDPTKRQHPFVGALVGGRPVFAFRSWTGPGMHYTVAPARRVPCESGLLGFVPVELLSLVGLSVEQVEAEQLGAIRSCQRPTRVQAMGYMLIGCTEMVVPDVLLPAEGTQLLEREIQLGLDGVLDDRRERTFLGVCDSAWAASALQLVPR